MRGSGGIPDDGSGSPPMSSMDPPRHGRLLYHSIDLPDVGDEVPIFLPQDSRFSAPWYPPLTAGTWRWSPDVMIPDPTFKTSSNALGLFTGTLHLHSLIQDALSSPSLAADPPNRRMKQHFWDSAADCSVRRLLIVLAGTEVVVDVEPSGRHGDIVRVGDVLQALKNKTAMANTDAWKKGKARVLVRGYY